MLLNVKKSDTVRSVSKLTNLRKYVDQLEKVLCEVIFLVNSYMIITLLWLLLKYHFSTELITSGHWRSVLVPKYLTDTRPVLWAAIKIWWSPSPTMHIATTSKVSSWEDFNNTSLWWDIHMFWHTQMTQVPNSQVSVSLVIRRLTLYCYDICMYCFYVRRWTHLDRTPGESFMQVNSDHSSNLFLENVPKKNLIWMSSLGLTWSQTEAFFIWSLCYAQFNPCQKIYIYYTHFHCLQNAFTSVVVQERLKKKVVVSLKKKMCFKLKVCNMIYLKIKKDFFFLKWEWHLAWVCFDGHGIMSYVAHSTNIWPYVSKCKW